MKLNSLVRAPAAPITQMHSYPDSAPALSAPKAVPPGLAAPPLSAQLQVPLHICAEAGQAIDSRVKAAATAVCACFISNPINECLVRRLSSEVGAS